MMDSQKEKLINEIVNKAEAIAKALKGGDVEIRRSPDGITVAEIRRKVVAR